MEFTMVSALGVGWERDKEVSSTGGLGGRGKIWFPPPPPPPPRPHAQRLDIL